MLSRRRLDNQVSNLEIRPGRRSQTGSRSVARMRTLELDELGPFFPLEVKTGLGLFYMSEREPFTSSTSGWTLIRGGQILTRRVHCFPALV